MGLFSNIFKAQAPVQETEERSSTGTLFNGQNYLDSMSLTNYVTNDSNITQSEAISISAFHRGVNLIAEKISNLPIHLYADNKRIDTPLLLEKPYPYETRKDTIYAWVLDYLINGNCFGILSGFDMDMYPTIIIPVASSKVTIQQAKDGRITYAIEGKVYQREEIFHIKAFHMPGEPYGLGALRLAAKTLNHAHVQNKHSYETLRDGSIPPMILESPIAMDIDEKRQLKEAWIAAQANSRVPAVLDAGLTAKEYGFSNHENQLLEARRFAVVEIANHLNIDAYWLNSGDGGSNTYNNVEQKTIQLISDTLEPIYVRFEHAFSALMRPGQYVKFNPDAMKRVDLMTRYKLSLIHI